MSKKMGAGSASRGDARRTPGNYEVGYARPPKEHRFKPGQSGNPRGRPKGSQNEETSFREVVSMTIPMKVGDKIRRVPLMKAVWSKVAQEALKGDPRAINLLINRYRQLEGLTPGDAELSPDDKLVLDGFVRDLRAELKEEFNRRKEGAA